MKNCWLCSNIEDSQIENLNWGSSAEVQRDEARLLLVECKFCNLILKFGPISVIRISRQFRSVTDSECSQTWWSNKHYNAIIMAEVLHKSCITRMFLFDLLELGERRLIDAFHWILVDSIHWILFIRSTLNNSNHSIRGVMITRTPWTHNSNWPHRCQRAVNCLDDGTGRNWCFSVVTLGVVWNFCIEVKFVWWFFFEKYRETFFTKGFSKDSSSLAQLIKLNPVLNRLLFVRN